MQVASFICDSCGEDIDTQQAPIVSYLTLGLTNLASAQHPEGFDFTGHFIPETVRKLLAQPVPRLDLCMECKAALDEEPLVNGKGEKKVIPATKQRAVKAFVARGHVSVRAEHPNHQAYQARIAAEKKALDAGQGTPTETVEEKRARLQRELASLDQVTTKRSAKKARAAAAVARARANE